MIYDAQAENRKEYTLLFEQQQLCYAWGLRLCNMLSSAKHTFAA